MSHIKELPVITFTTILFFLQSRFDALNLTTCVEIRESSCQSGQAGGSCPVPGNASGEAGCHAISYSILLEIPFTLAGGPNRFNTQTGRPNMSQERAVPK